MLELVKLKMKNCYSFFIVTFLILFKTKCVVSEKIPSNLVLVDSSPSLSTNTQEMNNNEERLDRIERKVDELQNKEIFQLRQDHDELKNMFLKMINQQQQMKTLNNIHQDKLFDLNYEEAIETDPKPKARSLPEANDGDHQIRIKRPFRLVSFPSINQDSTKYNNLQEPPTSCKDLSQLGYTLNGFYPVQLIFGVGTEEKKIGIVYCNFRPDANVMAAPTEKRVGLMTIKSSPIYFYVQRKSNFAIPNAVIPYEVELLNEGGALDLSSGVFRAPVSGVYYFSFKSFTGSERYQHQWIITSMALRLNGNTVTTSTIVFGGLMVSLECTLKLNQGDLVDIKKGPTGTLEDNHIEHLTHFSGSLLDEYLTF